MNSLWGSAQRGEESGCGGMGGAKRKGEHPCRSQQWELWLSLEAWAKAQHKSATRVVRWPAFQTEKHSHGAWSSCSLSELASLRPWCQVVEHLICQPENWYYRIVFFFFPPEQRVHSVTGPGVKALVGVGEGWACKGTRSPLLGKQINTEGCWVPPAHTTPCVAATLKAASRCRD